MRFDDYDMETEEEKKAFINNCYRLIPMCRIHESCFIATRRTDVAKYGVTVKGGTGSSRYPRRRAAKGGEGSCH
jgi:hypothetical protein